jgi:hypothetical protein
MEKKSVSKTATPSLSATAKSKTVTKTVTSPSKPVIASKPATKTISKPVVSSPDKKEPALDKPAEKKSPTEEEVKSEPTPTTTTVTSITKEKMAPKKMPIKKKEPEKKGPEMKNWGLPIPSEKMVEVETARSTELCEEKDTFNLDVCFMLDCTGSMSSYIQMAKEKIQEIMQQLKAQYTDSIVRIGILAYRDIKDQDRFDILDFNDSADIAKSFLGKQAATGGDDTPEDVNGAMQLALYTLDWKFPTRMLYHISDAPCHGKTYHDTSDNHPNGYKEDAKWERLMQGLKNMDVSYLYFDIESATQKMFNAFKVLYDKFEVKDNLIFSYEVLKSINSNYVHGDMDLLMGSRAGGEERYDYGGGGGPDEHSKEEVHKKFVSKTVESAVKSRVMNVEKMAKKKMSKPIP